MVQGLFSLGVGCGGGGGGNILDRGYKDNFSSLLRQCSVNILIQVDNKVSEVVSGSVGQATEIRHKT